MDLILSKPRLLRRAQLNGVSKGGEHPLWSRAGFKPRSRCQIDLLEKFNCAGFIPRQLFGAFAGVLEVPVDFLYVRLREFVGFCLRNLTVYFRVRRQLLSRMVTW